MAYFASHLGEEEARFLNDLARETLAFPDIENEARCLLLLARVSAHARLGHAENARAFFREAVETAPSIHLRIPQLTNDLTFPPMSTKSGQPHVYGNERGGWAVHENTSEFQSILRALKIPAYYPLFTAPGVAAPPCYLCARCRRLSACKSENSPALRALPIRNFPSNSAPHPQQTLKTSRPFQSSLS